MPVVFRWNGCRFHFYSDEGDPREPVFEDGDPELIAVALNNVARAKGLANGALTAQSDIGSVIATLTALGLELTAKTA